MNQIRRLEECMIDAIESIGNGFDCLIIADNRSEKLYRNINIINDNIYTISDITRRDKKWIENNFKNRKVLVYGDILTARNDILYYYLLAKIADASKVRLKVYALDTSYNIFNGVKFSGIKLGGKELWDKFNMSETILDIEKYLEKQVEVNTSEANKILKEELKGLVIPRIIGTNSTDRVVTTLDSFKKLWNKLPKGYETFTTFSSLTENNIIYCIRVTNTIYGNKYSELVNECIISCRISTNKNIVVYEPIIFMNPVDVDSVKSIVDIYGSKKFEYSSDGIDYNDIIHQLKQSYFKKFIEVIRDVLSNPNINYKDLETKNELSSLDVRVLNKAFDIIGNINLDLELTEIYLLIKRDFEDESEDDIKGSILKAIMTLLNDDCCSIVIGRRDDKYQIASYIKYDIGSKVYVNMKFDYFYKILYELYIRYGVDNKKVDLIESVNTYIGSEIDKYNKEYLINLCKNMKKNDVLKKFILGHEYKIGEIYE